MIPFRVGEIIEVQMKVISGIPPNQRTSYRWDPIEIIKIDNNQLYVRFAEDDSDVGFWINFNKKILRKRGCRFLE